MNKLFMAFAKGKESVEGNPIKKYIGVAPVYVLAVNPTKAELEKLYETDLEEGPEYVGETEVGPEDNKHKVPQVRIDFIVQTDPDKCNGIDMKTKVTFFLVKDVQYNNLGTSIKVINKYGECTYLPIECVNNGAPAPEKQAWFDTSDMRPVYRGEEELTDFIKKYLNIPGKSYRKKNGEVVEIQDLSEAEARLDKIENYFKGDFSELKEIISLQPKNKVKVLFGVRTTDDNKQYQAAYIKMFLKNHVTDYSKLDADVQERKSKGAYPTTEFVIDDLKEYAVESTNFDKVEDSSDLPFDSEGDNSPWFNN